MPKIVDLTRAKGKKSERDAIKAKIAKFRRQGENVDMPLAEMRVEILELWDRIEQIESKGRKQ